MSDWGAQHSTLSAIFGLDVRRISCDPLALVNHSLDRCLCRVISLLALGRRGGEPISQPSLIMDQFPSRGLTTWRRALLLLGISCIKTRITLRSISTLSIGWTKQQMSTWMSRTIMLSKSGSVTNICIRIIADVLQTCPRDWWCFYGSSQE